MYVCVCMSCVYVCIHGRVKKLYYAAVHVKKALGEIFGQASASLGGCAFNNNIFSFLQPTLGEASAAAAFRKYQMWAPLASLRPKLRRASAAACFTTHRKKYSGMFLLRRAPQQYNIKDFFI